MSTLVYVFVGGGTGALLRYGLNILGRIAWGGAPWATLIANGVGALLMGGLMATLIATDRAPTPLQIGLTTGLLGGLTTFSTFSYESLDLLRTGQVSLAVFYMVVSVVGCLGAAWMGYRWMLPA